MDAPEIVTALFGGGTLGTLGYIWARHRSAVRQHGRADAAALVTYVEDDASRDRAERDEYRDELKALQRWIWEVVMPYIGRQRAQITRLGGDPEDPPEQQP